MRHQAIHLIIRELLLQLGIEMQRHGRIVFHFERLCLNFPVHFEKIALVRSFPQSESAFSGLIRPQIEV